MLFYNKAKKNLKSMGVAKFGVVSCAFLGNSILAGCANSEGALMMNKTSQQLTERSDSGGDNITSFDGGAKKNNSGDSKNGGSCGKITIAALAGLAAGSLAFGLGFGLPWTDRGTEIDNLHGQVGYLVSQNMELNSSVQDLTGLTAAQASQIQNLTAANTQLSTTLNNTLSDMNDLTQPDHFKTLDATLTLQNGTSVALNYSSFVNYFGKSNSLNLTIDQTSAIDMNSIPIVAGSLAPTGNLQVNLLPTDKNICGNNVIDLSRFTAVKGITINGELYRPIIGPPNVDDIDTTTPGDQASYDLASGFFNLTNLKACGGPYSYIESSDSTPVYISDTSTPPNPIVAKLGGSYIMAFSDFQNCFSDVLNGTNFLNNGTLMDGTSYTTGQFLDLNAIYSDSIIYALAPSMTDLKFVRIASSGLTGTQINNLLTNMGNHGDVFCAREVDIFGDVLVPENLYLVCNKFECTNIANVSTCTNSEWSQNFLFGSQLNNAKIIIAGSPGDTMNSRYPLYTSFHVATNSPSGGNGSPIYWANGTQFNGSYVPSNVWEIWSNSGNIFVGSCYAGQN